MKLFLTVLLAAGAFASPAPQKLSEKLTPGLSYNVSVQEGDVLLRERITILAEGLQKIEVPQHHNLEHVEVYLDFTNNVEVLKYIDLKKCQVSTLPHTEDDTRKERAGLEYARTHIYSPQEARERKFSRIETPEPLEDVSFLRPEIREACKDVPTYLTEMIDMAGKNENESFMMHGTKAQYEQILHRQRRATAQTSFNCPITMFNQKCKLFDQARSCYWFVLCKGLNVSKPCTEHLRSGNIQCTPCCTHPSSPRDTKSFFVHCDVLKW